MSDSGREACSDPPPLEPPSPATPLPQTLEDLRERLVRAVRHVCPSWLRDQSEDIVQAALLRLLHVQEFREPNLAFPSSYLWKAAYSATLDEIRRAQRRREVPIEASAVAGTSVAREGDPLESRSHAELAAAIRACLRGMGADRAAVAGFHLLGHRVSEMQTRFGWDEKRVRNLLSRGLADLRVCLERKGLGPWPR